MGLRILKKLISGLVIVSLLWGSTGKICVLAAAEEYPLLYEEVSESDDPVVVLLTDEEDYTVLPGESLWKIAEKLWGDGNGYEELAELNKDQIEDPDLIFPGMSLKVSKAGTIIRKEAKYGGAQMGNYAMDMPHNFRVGILQSGDAFANFAMFGDGSAIACLIQDRKRETALSVRDWEQCKKYITDYVDENYGDQVSNLNFEHYLMKDQEGASGELYLYSYSWQISADYPDLKYSICVGLKLTDHIQAEFVGYGTDYDIHGGVRYMAATFEEHFDPKSNEKFTVNDSNMQMSPEAKWELDGVFNSFAWVDEFFTSMLNKALGVEEEKSAREKLMERMQP